MSEEKVTANEVTSGEWGETLYAVEVEGSDIRVDRAGNFQVEAKDNSQGVGGNYLSMQESSVSAQFNQLKGKLFNLIDGAIADEQQREALKGLVRGFCNEHYKHTVNDLDYISGLVGFYSGNKIMGSNPLERE